MTEEEFRTEARAAFGAAKSSVLASDTAVQAAAGILRGCCWLEKDKFRDCHNDFTAEQCAQAARMCGCKHDFVLGGVCP
jgi:hypothetical protein